MTLYINLTEGIKQANAHIVTRDAVELFQKISKVKRHTNLQYLEVRAIKYLPGWFGYDTEDVITAIVKRPDYAVTIDGDDMGLVATVEQREQGLGRA